MEGAFAAASPAGTRATPRSSQLERAAKDAYAEAKFHKREAALHKRAQRRAMQRFDKFREDLEAMGIQVVVEDNKPPMHSKEAHQ